LTREDHNTLRIRPTFAMSSEPPALSKPEESSSTDKDSLAKKSEDFDETEKTLGISEYLTTSVGFSGVVKARFSDFLVHEVGLDGSIARLTNLEVPASSSKKQEPEPSIVETKEEAPEQKERKPYDWPALQSELDAMIKDPSIAETLMKLLQTHNRKEECEEKFVFMPPLEKAERRSIHEWVRGSLPCARSDNGDNGCIRIWHVKFENQMNNYKTFADPRKKKQKLSWPTDRPDFLQFVMYKGMFEIGERNMHILDTDSHRIGFSQNHRKY
jgi:tRNA pseudouridine13 synthase